ncbi:MAG TPA: contractile injection system protein, VgrG/Pvc8 family, partial [Solirubrobacteraceae bacterium]
MSTLPLLPAATVKLDGTALSPEVESLLVSLRMRDSLRLPDQATLRLADPQLVRVDDGLLAVGKKLEIACAPPGSSTETTVFSGPIQSIELELVGEGAFIAATAYEPAFALHRNRRTRAFQDMTPADVAQQVISGAGLSASVTSSGGGGVSQKFLLQNDETDWDLLWRLADAIDYEVVGDGTTVHFRAAGASSGGAIALKAPDQLLSFRPRITGVQQVDSVTVRGWDPSTAEAIVADKSVPSPDTELGVQRASVASAAGGGTWAVADRTVVSQAEADALAQSLAARMGNAWVEAD